MNKVFVSSIILTTNKLNKKHTCIVSKHKNKIGTHLRRAKVNNNVVYISTILFFSKKKKT
jgi:hypothetical protein